MLLRRRNNLAAALAIGLIGTFTACSAQGDAAVADEQEAKPKLGLFTTLPIYWGEGDFDAILADQAEPDWVRAELETRFELVPLDTLEPEALEELDRVFLAQPRPLAPSENVAFDAFLAEGGAAVIMADPMLTRHSEFGIGDRRRPQDVAVLSPILNRLGVRLVFDEEQPRYERIVTDDKSAFPVNLSGRFEVVPSGDNSRNCSVQGSGLLAYCTNGQGKAYLYADAALLDWEGEEPVPDSRKEALWGILMPLVSMNGPAQAE